MTSAERALLFLDVDGPLTAFGSSCGPQNAAPADAPAPAPRGNPLPQRLAPEAGATALIS
ncbi:hypothetical protein [Streptomyces sp. NPDC012466]|uniref:hypothetical protein n=1 Tax=Streptomyces sp. NPDC012466 TaxID=3364835 RepID=UPI0036E303B3